MKNEDMNRNELITEEVFTEKELSELNETLKKNENIEMPEKLNKENIKAQLQKEVNKLELLEKESETIKKENKNLFKKMIAVAAVFAIVVTTVFIAKPWKYMNVKEEQITENNKQVVSVEDYSEIENMFLGYQKNYQKMQKLNYATDIYGYLTDGVIAEDSMEEGYFNTNSSPNTNTGAVAGTGSQYLKGDDVLYESVTEKYTSSENSDEHGETNEQVKGVNEADIIKNDGKFLYVVPAQKTYWEYQSFLEYGKKLEETTSSDNETVSDSVYFSPGYNPNEKLYADMTEDDFINRLYIVETGAEGSLTQKGEIKLGKHENEKIKYSEVKEIFVDGERLVAILDCYSFYGEEKSEEKTNNGRYFYYDYKMVTCAISYNISDKSNPVEEWRVYQDGDYLSARKIGNKIILISNYYVPLYLDGEDIKTYCVPEVYCGTDACRIPSKDICVMGEVKDSSYVVVSTLDATNKETFNSTAVLGGGENVYCSADNLYVTSGRYEETVSSGVDAVAEIFMIDDTALYTTEILKFNISGEAISYETKGSVKGYLLNQFSMDEYNGYLRIATTNGNFTKAENNVYILDSDMVIVGMLEGLAKGETIKSVRFMGDTGYVVTFVQTDPLFVIDLANPEKPEVLGELKIPGFSNYLHPVSENYLLGIGVNGTESGAGNGMKISLFDVSDKKNPKEVSKFEVVPQENGDNLWGYLECVAFYDHKAVCWDSKNLIMYIPYTITTEYMHTEDNSYRSEFNSTDNIIALQVDINEGKLKKLNNYVVKTSEGSYNRYQVNRVTYSGETVYSYSQNSNEICSFNKTSAEKYNTIELK